MRLKAMLLAGALVLAAGTAHAQGDMWFGIGGGASLPTGDFGDLAKTGYFGNLSGTYMMTKEIGIGVDFGYHGWGAKDEFVDATNVLLGVTDADITISAIQFDAHGKYVIPTGNEKLMPYLKVGLGAYNSKFKVEATGVDEEETSTDFGFNVGGGVNFLVSPMYAIGVNAAFHQIQTEDEATNLVTAGVSLLFGLAGK